MKRIALFVMAASFSFAAQAELTVDEVIAKNIEARGGYEAIKSLESARFQGVASFGGTEAPVLMEWVRPDKVRMEFELQGMKMVQAYDGENGWAIMPFLGKTEPEPMADDQLKDIKEQADLDGELVDYKEKGHSVELVGLEEVEGTDAYHLIVTRKNGDVSHTYLDSEYFLEFKEVSKTDRQGVEVTINTIIGDYKEVGGMLIPHSFETTAEGAPVGQSITITNIEPNVDLGDDHFSMPEANVQ
jgi:outer membrane lipoprotein-sorting protein